MDKRGKRTGKQIVSMVLIVTLLAGMVPQSVYAQRPEQGPEVQAATVSAGDRQSERTQNAGRKLPEEWKGLGYALFTEAEAPLSLYTSETAVIGDVHSNQDFTYMGSTLKIDGTLEASGKVSIQTAQGEESCQVAAVAENADRMVMPDIREQLYDYVEANGMVYQESTDFYEDTISVNTPIAIQGSSSFQGTGFSGRGIIYAEDSVTCNLAEMTTPADSALFLASAKGDIILNGADISLNAVLYAPNGCVYMNGSRITLNGRVIAGQIRVNEASMKIQAGEHDLDMLDFLLKREFQPPEAGLELSDSCYLRNEEGVARIEVRNTAHATDGDRIEQISYQIYHDSNGNGSFEEEELVLQKETMDDSWVYETKDVGKYRIRQVVREEVPEEWKQPGHEPEREELQTTAETERFFEVGNQRPGTGLDIRKKNSVDILYTYELQDAKELEKYQEQQQAVTEALKEQQIDVQSGMADITPVRVKDSFTWEEYRHEGEAGDCYKDLAYDSLDGCRADKISFTVEQKDFKGLEGSGILFGAGIEKKETEGSSYHGHTYQVLPPGRPWDEARAYCESLGGYPATVTSMEEWEYIDANVLGDERYSMYYLGGYQVKVNNLLQWKWVTDEDFYWTRWDVREPNNPAEEVIEVYGSYKAPGYWNDTYVNPQTGWAYGYEHVGTICEWNGDEISGYVLLLTAQGMKLIYLDHADLFNFTGGSYEYAESAGKLLATFPYDVGKEKHDVTILCEGNRLTIKDGEDIIAGDFEPGEEPAGNGLGPIVSYTRQEKGTGQRPEVRNLKVTEYTGQTMQKAVEDYEWRAGAEHLVVCCTDGRLSELTDNAVTGKWIELLYDKEAGFIGIGNGENAAEWNKIEKSLDNSYTDDTQDKWQKLQEYILSLCRNRNLEIGTYITTDDMVEYTGVYQDAENDPMYEQYWEYTYMEHADSDTETDKITGQETDPIQVFEVPGIYSIKLRVRDNPAGDNDALDSYRLWSEEQSYEKLLLVQHRPKAAIQADIRESSEEDKCIVNVTYSAEDEDHMDDSRLGIRQESFAYKTVRDEAWTEGRLPNKVDRGEQYLVRYQVTDMDGCQSAKVVKLVDTAGEKTELTFEDTEKPEIVLKISKPIVEVRETVRIEGFATDNYGIDSFSLYIDDKKMLDTAGQLTYSPKEAGTVTVRAEAVDLAGNTREQTKTFRVYPRVQEKDECPEIAVTDITFNDDKSKVLIKGTVTDDVALSRYHLSWTDADGHMTLLGEGKEEVPEPAILAEVETADLNPGLYKMIFEAEDKAGNRSYLFIDVTYSRTSWVIETEIKGEIKEDEESTGTDPADQTEPIDPTDPTEPTDPAEPTEPAEPEYMTLSLSHSVAEIGTKVQVQVTLPSVMAEETLRITMGETLLAEGKKKTGFTLREAGTATITATGTTGAGQEVSVSASCTFYNLQDKKAPVADMTAPGTEEPLTGPADIMGSAYDEEELDFYRLEYRPVGAEEYTVITKSPEPKKNEVLGHLDTTMLRNGQYEVRLWVQDKGGNIRKATAVYTVEGGLKAGAMNLGFTDITAALSGVKVSVNRLYDSSNKKSGDFGYGWTLDMQGLEIIENGSLTEGYEMVKTGSLFSTGYRLVETADHDVTVVYGDGTSDRFALTMTPEKQALVPISETKIGYRCITNPKVKLELLGDTTAFVSDGSLTFYDESMYGIHAYKLTMENGTEVFYRQRAGIYQMTDSNGSIIHVDQNGYHGTDGRSIAFTRDEAGRITGATDPAGNVTAYTYDDRGNLAAVTDSADRRVTFTYDDKHNLISITDPMGIAVARNEYDAAGRLIAVTDAAGNRMEYEYDGEGRQQVVKDCLGNPTIYTYDDNGNILSITDAYGNQTVNTYDEHNNVLTTTDANGNTTSYTYDTTGNMTEVTAADGTKVQSTYTQENLVAGIQMSDSTMMAFAYDGKGRMTSIEDANGNTTEYSYTEDGRLTGLTDAIGEYRKITYDEAGNAVSTTNGAGESASYTYDEEGRCTAVTISREENGEIRTFTSHYSYNEAGDITESVDNAGNVTTYEYDANGNRTASTDAEGRRITYEYDPMGNMVKTTYPDGTFETFTYDGNGNNLTATDRMGQTVTMQYDKLNRLIQQTYADGSKETYGYDAVGNVVEQMNAGGAKTTYTYDCCNRNTAVTDAMGHTTTFDYDKTGRLTARKDALDNSTTYEYDAGGNLLKTTYADGNSITAEYDARNRVICQKDQNGNRTLYAYDGADRLVRVTDAYDGSYAYEYDDNGNLVTVTDAEGNRTSYTYDAAGRVGTIRNAMGKTASYTYDKTGSLTAYQDYAGTVTAYVYDGMGRMIRKTTGEDVTAYTYDSKGLLTEVKDKSGVTVFGYDNCNRLEQVTDTRGSQMTYTYDGAGRRKTFDNGYGKTAYEYDLLDRITRVIDRNGQATVYEYDALGNRSAVRYPNGSVMTYTYDACQRLREECITGADGILLAKYTYGLGKAGERLSVTEVNSGRETTTAYEYDKLNRLVKETIQHKDSSLTNTYVYDRNGNRTEKHTEIKGDITDLAAVASGEVQLTEGKTVYTYNALNQLVTEQCGNGVTGYSYDDNGNLIKQTGNRMADYTYDKENHLLRATIQKGNAVTTESYTYDYAGNRASRTVNETDTLYYVNDISGSLTRVTAETDGNGTEKAYFSYGEDLISMESAGKVCYYLYDGHGSVRLLTNGAGRITDRYAYDAYGSLLQKEGDTENEFLYTGEQYHAGTGLYYLRARYMNPSTGTFISMDSYPGNCYDPVSLHKYLYANANPVMYTDPSGYMAMLNMMTATSLQNEMRNSYDMGILKVGLRLMADARALRSTYAISSVAPEIILGVGLGVGLASSANAVHEISIKLMYQSLNAMTMAYLVVGDYLHYIVTPAMEASQAYVEAKAKPISELKKSDYRGFCVYVLRDEFSENKVRYVGMTNDPWRRKNEHEKDLRKQTNGKIWKMYVIVIGLTKAEARAMEQSLICIYTIDALANARYEIAQKNYGKFMDEIERAADIAHIPLPDLMEAMDRRKK